MDLPKQPGALHAPPPPTGPADRPRTVRLTVDVPFQAEAWILPDTNWPETCPHRDAVDLLRGVLKAFVARTGRNALVGANLGCYWDAENPRVGVDPDIAFIEPAPPEGAQTESLRAWVAGHVAPRFVVEVVNVSNPTKDYGGAPAKYGFLGVRELVVFDPWKEGPRAFGGPYVLQVWRRGREASGAGKAVGGPMVRVHAGEGPAYSEELGAWLVVMGDGRLRVAEDAAGASLWLVAGE